MSKVDLDLLNACVGNISVREDEVRPGALAQFLATFDGYAELNGVEAIPPGFHWTMFQPITASGQLRDDGHPKEVDLLPALPFATRMWAGGEVRFLSPLSVGDKLMRQSTVRSVDLKSGASGELLFIEIGHEYRVDEQLKIEETQTLVYRDPGKARPASSVVAASGRGVPFCADSRLLFRYSALTFNTHRIHYDREYAVKEEGYQDLVVHGPLQATLIMSRIAQEIGHARFGFLYRGIAPLFAGQTASIWVDPDGSASIERAPDDATMKGKCWPLGE